MAVNLTLYEAAHIATMAYHSGATSHYVEQSFHAETDTRLLGIFDRRRSALYLAFRGTFSLRNWYTNLRFSADGGCHAGISDAVDYHQDAAFAWLKRFGASHIYVVGHSLGGGLANELMRRLYAEGYRDVLCVTFGAVRCHTKAVVQSSPLGAQTVRVVNNNDIVARLLGLSFDHIGRELYFDRKGKWHRHMPFWQRLWDQIRGRWHKPITDGVEDHSMQAYTRLCSLADLTVEGYLGGS